MSRIIKMNFWCKERQEMFIWQKHFNSITIIDNNVKPVINNSVKDSHEWYKLNYVPLMYTGMKDRNNKEIYEGDILRHLHMRNVIIFEDGTFKFKWLDETTKRIRKYNEPMFKNTNIVFSVVGNIFENPELLKERVD